MYAIGLCFDEIYLLPGLVTIMSVAESTSAADRKSIAIRTITNDLTKAHAEAIADFVKALGFGSFDHEWRRLDERYRIIDIDYITATTYLRFDFSPDYVQRPYLVYLDSDVLVLDDIASPFNSLDASGLGAVPDEFLPTVGERNALPGLVRRFPSLGGSPYFNAGALWLNTNVMQTVKHGVRNVLSGSKRRYIRFNDQDAMNIWLLEHRCVAQLPGHLNRFEIGRELEQSDRIQKSVPALLDGPRDASVLHFVGWVKPWHKQCPTTPGVRLYRNQLAEAERLLRKLGIRTIGLKRCSPPQVARRSY
jgi:lipopolysaccharide biosynthesis glycosyltransferase